MKFCLNITSIGYPSYAEAIKMYMTRVRNKSNNSEWDITYIDISSMARLKELTDETGHEVIIAPPRKWRDEKHYVLEIYDDYRE